MMFPDIEYSFNGLKHLTEKVTAVASLTRVRVVVDHTMSTPPDNKVKDLALLHCNFDQCLHRTPSFVKKHLEQAFFYVFFTHICLMKCLSSMVNIISVTTLLLTSSLHRC